MGDSALDSWRLVQNAGEKLRSFPNPNGSGSVVLADRCTARICGAYVPTFRKSRFRSESSQRFKFRFWGEVKMPRYPSSLLRPLCYSPACGGTGRQKVGPCFPQHPGKELVSALARTPIKPDRRTAK